MVLVTTIDRVQIASRRTLCLLAIVMCGASCSLLFTPEEANSDVGDADAGSPWNEPQFQRRVPVAVTNSGSEDLEAFPILLRIEEPAIVAAIANSGGAILLVDHEGRAVNFERDNGVADQGLRMNLWFAATLAAGEQQTYWLYYENSEPVPAESAADVFASYDAAWHMTTVGRAGVLLDSSESQIDLTQTGGTLAEGRIGDAISASGQAGAVASVVSEDPVFQAGACLSVSAWILSNSEDAEAHTLFNSFESEPAVRGVRLDYQDGSEGPRGQLATPGIDGRVTVQVPPEPPPQLTRLQWAHVGLLIGASSAQLVINGALQLPVLEISEEYVLQLAGKAPLIGEGLSGTVDEVRVSTSCRSTAWMTAEYLSIADPLATLGTPERQGASPYIAREDLAVDHRELVVMISSGMPGAGLLLSRP